VGVPTAFSFDDVPLHCLPPTYHVLEQTRNHVVNSWPSVRCGGSFQESEWGCAVTACLYALYECILIAPGLHQGCLKGDGVEVACRRGHYHQAVELWCRLEVEGVARRAPTANWKGSKAGYAGS
jgi:hypothetical protein